jgi:hypothetical protein
MAEQIDKWQASPAVQGKLADGLDNILTTLTSIQKFNQAYINALKESFEVAKSLQLDIVNALLAGIQTLIDDIKDTLQAYEEMGYYFINIDPYTITQDTANPNFGSYRVVDTDLVPAYRASNGELRRIRNPQMSGQIFTGQDADGNPVSQEYLNLGVTRIGLTVPTPVSEKTPSPNTGWDGTVKMSPQQVRDELVEAFDDEYDDERPTFPDNSKMSGIVVIAAGGSAADFPDLLDTITSFFEIDSLKNLASEIRQMYTEPEEASMVLKYVCKSRYDERTKITTDNEDGAVVGRFEEGDYIRKLGPGPAHVAKITKIKDTKDQVILKEPTKSKYPIEMTNTFLDNIVNSVQNQTGSQASSLAVSAALNNTTQLTASLLKNYITPTATSGTPETVQYNPKRYQTQEIEYVPLTKGWSFIPGNKIAKAVWRSNNPTSVVVKNADGTTKEISNREAAELDPSTTERLPADYVEISQNTPSVGEGATLGEVSRQNDIQRVSYAPDFKKYTIADIVPAYGTVIRQIRSYVVGFENSIKPSSAALDKIIDYLDEKFKQIEDFYTEMDNFTSTLISAADAIAKQGLYVLYLNPETGGSNRLKERIEKSEGLPENTPYGLGFGLFAGGPTDNKLLDPNAPIINLANFLGLDSQQVQAVVTQDADQSKKDSILIRGQKDPEDGGLIIEANVRIYFELTGKAPVGWQYNALLDDFVSIGQEQTFEEKLNALSTYGSLVTTIKDSTIKRLETEISLISTTTEDSTGLTVSLPQTLDLATELQTQLNEAEESSQVLLDTISLRRKQLLANKANALSSTGNTVILTTGSWDAFNVIESTILTISNTSSSTSAGDVRTVSFVTNSSTLSVDEAFTLDLDQEQNWIFRLPDPDIADSITSKTVRLGVMQNFQGKNGEIINNTDGVDKMTFLPTVLSSFPTLPFPNALTGNTQLLQLNAKRGGFKSANETEDFNWEKLNISLGDEITAQDQTVKVVYIPYEEYLPVDTDGTGVFNTFPETSSISSGGNGKGDKNSVIVIPWPPVQGSNTFFAVNDYVIEMDANTTLPRVKAFDPELAAEFNYTIKKFSTIVREKEDALTFERQQALEYKDDQALKNFDSISSEFLTLSSQLSLIESNVS